MHKAVFGRKDEKDAVPAVGVFSAKFTGDKVVIWVHPKGKASLFEDGKLAPAARALTDAGYAVVAMDVLGVGELTPEKPFAVDKNFAGYTYGYNRPLLANRVHDVLTMVAFGRTILKAKTIHVVGWGEFGPIAVLAKALAGDAVVKTAADLDGTLFHRIEKSDDPMMLPGAVKYSVLATSLGLCAPGEVLAHNHRGTSTGKWSKAAYDAAGTGDKLTRVETKLDEMKVVEWLTK